MMTLIFVTRTSKNDIEIILIFSRGSTGVRTTTAATATGAAARPFFFGISIVQPAEDGKVSESSAICWDLQHFVFLLGELVNWLSAQAASPCSARAGARAVDRLVLSHLRSGWPVSGSCRQAYPQFVKRR